MEDENDQLISLGIEPITDGNPAGVFDRDDPALEELQEEISKLDMNGLNAVAWDKVQELATDILKNKNKNFVVAGYLALASAQREKIKGLDRGLRMLTYMAEHFWEEGYPPAKRERARVNSANWVLERCTSMIEEVEVGGGNASSIISLSEGLDRFADIYGTKATKEGLEITAFLRPLREKKRDADYLIKQSTEHADTTPNQNSEEAAAVPTSQVAAPAMAAAPAATLPTNKGPEFDKAVSDFRTNMLDFAKAMRTADIRDPRSYLIQRTAQWLTITSLPAANKSETLLPPPTDEAFNSLDLMESSENYELLINQAETMAQDYLFWLDPQRYVANALGKLGAEKAVLSVVAGLRNYLASYPQILELKFQGGKPFVSEPTRLWIDEVVLASEETGTTGGGDEVATEIKTQASQARKLAAGGKVAEAAKLLDEGMSLATNQRDQFRWALAKAQLCTDAGLAEAAVHIVVGLEDMAAEHDLEQWEPGLATLHSKTVLHALSKLPPESEMLGLGQIKDLRKKHSESIYRLNMQLALEIM